MNNTKALLRCFCILRNISLLGVEVSYANTDHSISTFFNDIQNLKEGTYKWDGNKFVKQ
jgi:hypothetical protein